MAKCEDCGKEMASKDTKSCVHNAIQIEGKRYSRDTSPFGTGERCHDCGIENKEGNTHHGGCDAERCPRCGGQLITCICKGKRWLR